MTRDVEGSRLNAHRMHGKVERQQSSESCYWAGCCKSCRGSTGKGRPKGGGEKRLSEREVETWCGEGEC